MVTEQDNDDDDDDDGDDNDDDGEGGGGEGDGDAGDSWQWSPCRALPHYSFSAPTQIANTCAETHCVSDTVPHSSIKYHTVTATWHHTVISTRWYHTIRGSTLELLCITHCTTMPIPITTLPTFIWYS